MEFPEVGDRCSLEGCSQLDFLPLKCTHCGSWFCKDHLSALAHECPNRPDNIVEEEIPKEKWQYRCCFSECQAKELVPIKCTHCSQHYCLQHRHPDQHGCVSTKQEKAKGQLEANPTVVQHNKVKDQINSKLQDVKEKGGTKGAMASKLALMKLKGRAEGDKAIPQSERVYFIISVVPNPDQNPKPLDMFFSKIWTAGKVVDVIAKRARIKNRNNQADAPKLHIFKGEICLSQPFDRSIAKLIQEGLLEDGDSISINFVQND